MSSNLYWRPLVPQKSHDLSDALKFVIERREWPDGGTLFLNNAVRLTSQDVPFLQGMLAAGTAEVRKDVKTLLAAIEKHDAVEIWLA